VAGLGLPASRRAVEEAAELVDGQLDQSGRGGFAFDRGGDGEEGVSEHGEGGPQEIAQRWVRIWTANAAIITDHPDLIYPRQTLITRN
jgi:hypothetical protein